MPKLFCDLTVALAVTNLWLTAVQAERESITGNTDCCLGHFNIRFISFVSLHRELITLAKAAVVMC